MFGGELRIKLRHQTLQGTKPCSGLLPCLKNNSLVSLSPTIKLICSKNKKARQKIQKAEQQGKTEKQLHFALRKCYTIDYRLHGNH